MYLLVMQKAINPCTQKRFLYKKSVKIGKDSTAKSEISKAKKAIKKLNNKVYSKRLTRNLKVLKDSLKAK